MGISVRNPTNLPSSTLADTSFAILSDEILRWFLEAKVSTENLPLRSVAVVMMASAPIPSAILRVSSLQPPMCPERRAIAHLPSSSMQTTAGSSSLLLMNGAMYLTAIPVAPMNTIASHSSKDMRTHSLTGPLMGSRPWVSEDVLQNRRTCSRASTSPSLLAVAHPLDENATTLIIIAAHLSPRP